MGKVFAELFSKSDGVKGRSPCRSPQRAEFPYRQKAPEKVNSFCSQNEEEKPQEGFFLSFSY